MLRNAGNIVPPYGASNGGESATIEYAVAALGVRDIVICGHSRCGAINALLHPEMAHSMPLVTNWLNHAETTRRIVSENYSHASGDDLLEIAVQEHVLVQVRFSNTDARGRPSYGLRLVYFANAFADRTRLTNSDR